MARYTRTPVSTLQGINNELAKVELAMEDTLDRKGVTPNFMDANLDMNSRRILNLPAPLTDQEPLRKGDIPTGLSVSSQYVDDKLADAFALKIFQSPTDGGLTEIQTRTVSGGEVYEVRKTSDDSLATIYSDAAGTAEIVQNGTSNVSDSAGVVEFYVDSGDYYINVGTSKSLFIAGIEDRVLNIIKLDSYGATPYDGTPIDSSEAINLALKECAKGVKLVIDKPYYYSQRLECISSSIVDIEFIGDGKLIADPSLDNVISFWISSLPYSYDPSVYWDGTKRSGGSQLAANADTSQKFVDLDDASSFYKGAYIYIVSEDAYLPSRTQYIKGEYRKVWGVTGNRVYLDGLLDDNYTASTTKAFLSEPPKVSLRGLKLIGADNENSVRGIRLWECRDVYLQSPEVEGFNDQGVDLSMCNGVTLTSASADYSDKSYSGSSRTSYSVAINSCRDVSVKGGTFRGGRHSFSLSGYIPNTNVNLSDMVVYGIDAYGNNVAVFDSHENTRNLSISHCTIYGGLDVAGQNVHLDGLTVYAANENIRACVVRVYGSCDYVKITDCTINAEDVIGGVIIRPSAPNISVKQFRQTGNTVNITVPAGVNRAGIGIDPSSQGAGCSVDLLVQENNVCEVDTSSAAVCMSCYDLNDFSTRVNYGSIILSGNRTVNLGSGACYDYYVADGGSCNLNVSDEKSVCLGESRNFSFNNMDTIDFYNNNMSMSTSGLAANAYNVFRNTRKVNTFGGKLRRSYKNGYDLINVAEHNTINVEREDCTIDANDFIKSNAKFIAHSWLTSDGNGNALDSFNCSVSRESVGRYRVSFTERQLNNTDFPVFFFPDPTTYVRNNFNSVVVVYDTDTPFNFLSF